MGGKLTLQVFVANPNKPPEIARILKRNKDRLLVFLKDFHNDKDGECGFMACCWLVSVWGLLVTRRVPQRAPRAWTRVVNLALR